MSTIIHFVFTCFLNSASTTQPTSLHSVGKLSSFPLAIDPRTKRIFTSFSQTMTESSKPSAPPKFSLAIGSKTAPPPKPKPRTSPKRTFSTLVDDEDAEPDTPDDNRGEILTFGGKAKKDAVQPSNRVIAPIQNRDWREEGIRKKQRRDAASETQKTRQVDNETKPDGQGATGTPEESNGSQTGSRTVEQEAIDALTGKAPAQHTQMVIAPPSPPPTEDEAFQNDYHNAPRTATVDEYTATPIEGFGAALLRGYLKPGQTLESITEKRKAPEAKTEKRKDLLGLGAKEMDLGVEAKGAKGKEKGGKGRIMREAGEYNPLARRNRKTGEVLGEDELKVRLDQQEQGQRRGGDRQQKHDFAERRERDNGDPRPNGREDRRNGDSEYHRDRRREQHDRSPRRERHRDHGYDDRKERGRDSRRRDKEERDYESRSVRHASTRDRSYDGPRHRR